MTIGVNHLENCNKHFSTKNVLAGKTHHEEAVGQGQTDRFILGGKGTEGAAYIERRRYVDHLYTPDGGDYDHFTTYIYDRSVYEDRIDTTDPAHIAAGGSLSLEAGRAVNDRSVMTAGKTLTIHGADIENRDEKGHKTVKEEGTATSYWTKRVHHGAHIHKRTETRTTRTDYMPADAVTDTTVIAAVDKAHTNPVYEGTKAEAYLSPSERKPLHISDSSLYHVTSDPTARYLVETDPAYADRKTFLSSDYFFRRMQYDPEKLEKRLGDGYYESQLVRDRLMQLKGKPAGETEYKALMDAAVRWAQENKDVRIGMALTEDQKAALKEDIVWMVESSVLLPDGNIVKALVPEVYLAHGKNGTLTGSALISAENIDIRATNDILSRGTVIAGDTMRLSASDINNEGGTIKASTLMEEALRDIRNTGTMEAENKLSLKAGQDINLASTLHKERNKQGYTQTIASSGKAAVTGNQGTLSIEAGRDITAEAAEISSAGDIAMKAGRDITMETAAVKKDTAVTWDGNNYRHDSAARDIGSSVTAKGSLTMQSERDISIKAADIRSEGMTAVKAGRNLTVENGKEITDLEEHHRHKERSLLSSTTTTTHDEVHAVQAQKSIIEGNTVSIEGGKDISLTGSAAASTKETTLSAGRNISINAAEETDKEIHKKQVKKSGLIGSGLGFTIGSEKKKDSYDTEETMQRGSTVGSVKGNVTIAAGQTASVRASDIIAGKDTLITGRNVDIESKDNIYRGKEEHEYKKSGLTVSLGGAVITAKDNIIRPIKNAGQAHDGLLGKLYAADAGFNLHDAVKTYKNIGDVKKGITLDVSLGTQSAKSDSRYQGTEAKESRIVSKGNVRIKSDENIAVKGSQITGENVTLQAGKDIHLTAAENRKTAEGNSRSKGAGITASFGIGGLQNVGISAGKSKGNMEEEIITHTGSAVTAKETLAMESGKDIDIKGSKAGGKKVEIKTGNNLSIESLQDSHAYHSRDKESGIHLQRDITARPDTGKKKMDDPYFSIGKKTDTTDSTYISVTKQAGIYAGKEGYDIQVKNNTHLKGAVIDSQAEKEKNRITTGTLTWENIDNKAEYKTGGHGISYNGKIGRGDKNDPLDSQTNNRYRKDTITGQRNGMNKITPTIYGSKIPLNERGLLNTPIPSVKGKAGTTTRSAISKGTITITDKENQKQDIEKLNRNTENSLNKLKEIFDKTKVEERKRLLEELGIVGNRAIHEIASHNGWKDGSTEKIALHGMLGAITSAKSGGSALSGLIAGGANEYAIGYLKKTKGKDWINKHPDTVQNISAAFGGILSKMTGGSGHTGAYISQVGTKWNEYLLTQLERSNKDLLIQKEAERETYDKKEDYSQEEINNAIAQGIVKEKDYFMSLANAYPGGAGIALEMSAMSDYEIQQKYGNQMTLIEDRTYVINQKSPFADTIMHSINYTNALGDAISRVRASGIRDQYVDFTVDIKSDSKTNKIFDNSSFLLAGAYSGNISIMIDSKGVIHEQSCLIDNYNFEKHSLSDSYEFNKIIELNNEAALSMQAGRLTPFMWILYINRTFSRFGINNEGE